MNFNFNQKSGARICPEKNICYFCTRNTDNTPPVEFRSVMQLIEKGAREWEWGVNLEIAGMAR